MTSSVADRRYQEGKWVSSTHKVWAYAKPGLTLEPKKTALFIIDMQNAFCAPDAEYVRRIKEVTPQSYSHLVERMKIVVPNLQRLQRFFRQHHLPVVQCVIASLTEDGRDRLPGHKAIGLHFPIGSRFAQVIDELKPLPDEVVFTKTAASAFSPPGTYYTLRNMGIERLVFGGGATGGCVESTVRAAFDLFGYNVVVEDCCISHDEERHIASIRAMGSAAAEIASTESVINHLTQQLEASGASK